MGSLWSRQDNYEQALVLYQRAFGIAQELEANVNAARHLGNIGWVYFLLGNFDLATKRYEEAFELAIKADDKANQANILMNLGKLLLAEKKPAEAAAKYEQAMKITAQVSNLAIQASCLEELGSLYVQSGEYEKARTTLQQALKLANEMGVPVLRAATLNNFGELHLRLNEPQPALEFFEQALQTANEINSLRNVWRAQAGLAVAYEKLGEMTQAQAHNRLAIAAMEGVRTKLSGEEEKASFLQDKIAVFKKQIALLFADKKFRHDAELFHYAERARARAFLDLLAEARISNQNLTDPDLLKRHRELQQRLAQLTGQMIKERSQETTKQDKAKIRELEKDLSETDTQMGDWLGELRQRDPRYASLKYPEPITLEKAQRMLDDQTVLLSYSLAEPGSFLFAVTRNEFQVKQLPRESVLREHVLKLLKFITDKNQPNTEGYRREAALLSTQLLQPVQHLLAGKKALLIVPDGALHRLPFEMLLLPGVAARGDLRQLPYLIRRFAISYAPSVSVLAELDDRKRNSAPKGFIAFGDPVYEQTAELVSADKLRSTRAERLSFQRLPHSLDEVQGIARLFGNDDSQIFLGTAANEENVKAPQRLSQYRFIHFSTHGYINESHPRLSALVLSLPRNSREPEDGLLSAYEIFNLKLNANLVVLSACDTGLGKEVNGEGLLSLLRAFMYAGTPSVVVSLWSVDDETAADLMIRFYRHLQKDGMSKREALRQAQLETINDNGFPFFWAPFVLVGQP